MKEIKEQVHEYHMQLEDSLGLRFDLGKQLKQTIKKPTFSWLFSTHLYFSWPLYGLPMDSDATVATG